MISIQAPEFIFLYMGDGKLYIPDGGTVVMPKFGRIEVSVTDTGLVVLPEGAMIHRKGGGGAEPAVNPIDVSKEGIVISVPFMGSAVRAESTVCRLVPFERVSIRPINEAKKIN